MISEDTAQRIAAALERLAAVIERTQPSEIIEDAPPPTNKAVSGLQVAPESWLFSINSRDQADAAAAAEVARIAAEKEAEKQRRIAEREAERARAA